MADARAGEWTWPAPEAILHPGVAARLAAPFRESRFTYERYTELLDRLIVDERVAVVPLRDLLDAPEDRLVVAIRHDVDDRLDSALHLAGLERDRGLSTTYFVLHTAPYYGRAIVPALRRLQELGHEVGWHNDLVTLHALEGRDPRGYLAGELERLRAAGIEIRGTSVHGSHAALSRGLDNRFFFSDASEEPRFANYALARSDRSGTPTGTLAEYGLDYDADHLGNDAFFSDAYFDRRGRRWHPDELDLAAYSAGEKLVLLLHPCHWDSSLAAKVTRVYGRVAARLAARRFRGTGASSAIPSSES